jgi:hypothetical protein
MQNRPSRPPAAPVSPASPASPASSAPPAAPSPTVAPRLPAAHAQGPLARFLGRGPLRFAELSSPSPLTADELALLLHFLDRLLAMIPEDGRREARSRDRRLRLVLQEPAAARDTAVLATTAGRFIMPAYILTVELAARRCRPRRPQGLGRGA